MKTLHLTLKKKWLDMILSGEKKEEYRDIKNFWFKRLFGKYITNSYTGEVENDNVCYATISQNKDLISEKFKPISFSTITFKNGYAADAPEIIVECKGIEIKEGNPEWGAEPGTKYFVISLGEILSTKNIK